MDPDGIREYAARDWSALERSKRQHWRREHQARGGAALMTAAAALYEHCRLLHPHWPTDDERARDLEHHVQLKRWLASTADVDRGR